MALAVRSSIKFKVIFVCDVRVPLYSFAWLLVFLSPLTEETIHPSQNAAGILVENQLSIIGMCAYCQTLLCPLTALSALTPAEHSLGIVREWALSESVSLILDLLHFHINFIVSLSNL